MSAPSEEEFARNVFVNCPFSGVDIKSHENDPVKVVRAIRNWFVETVGLRRVAGPAIWFQFTYFTLDLYNQRKQEGFSDDDLNMMPIPEYIDFIEGWVRSQKAD